MRGAGHEYALKIQGVPLHSYLEKRSNGDPAYVKKLVMMRKEIFVQVRSTRVSRGAPCGVGSIPARPFARPVLNLNPWTRDRCASAGRKARRGATRRAE